MATGEDRSLVYMPSSALGPHGCTPLPGGPQEAPQSCLARGQLPSPGENILIHEERMTKAMQHECQLQSVPGTTGIPILQMRKQRP